MSITVLISRHVRVWMLLTTLPICIAQCSVSAHHKQFCVMCDASLQALSNMSDRQHNVTDTAHIILTATKQRTTYHDVWYVCVTRRLNTAVGGRIWDLDSPAAQVSR